MNIVSEIRTQSHGEAIAIREGEEQITFTELLESVHSLSQTLRSHPCFSDHSVPRIGVHFPNGLAYIVLALAVLDTGACFVPIPDELTEDERTTLIENTALHGILSFAEQDEETIYLPLQLGNAFLKTCTALKENFPVEEFNQLNPAFIRFSSGTTADAKGVVLAHESLLARIQAANEGLELKKNDVVLWTLPMAHHFAVSIILYLYHGVCTVIETSHEPQAVYEAAKNSKCNLLYGSPFHFAQLAQLKEASPLASLRLAISTASALDKEIAKAFENRFQLPLTQALGIIEIGLPLLNRKHAHDAPTALGQNLPAYSVQTSNQDAKGVGELQIKGPGMFDAYLIPWQKREKLTSDGWFSTGDLVEEIRPGTWVLRGRNKSVINVGGMKVFPEEIEAVLNRHPNIQRSRVYAVKHSKFGSFPVAEIEPICCGTLPTSIELRDYCAQSLAQYKIPMRFTQVTTIALTANGKVKRHES